jgi:hypothetical protein
MFRCSVIAVEEQQGSRLYHTSTACAQTQANAGILHPGDLPASYPRTDPRTCDQLCDVLQPSGTTSVSSVNSRISRHAFCNSMVQFKRCGGHISTKVCEVMSGGSWRFSLSDLPQSAEWRMYTQFARWTGCAQKYTGVT